MHLENASVELAEADLRVEEFDRVVRLAPALVLVPAWRFDAVGELAPVGRLEPQPATVITATSAKNETHSRIERA